MKRLTKREPIAGHNLAYVSGDDCFDVWSVPKKFMGNAIDRLATIEDILGDEYDIDKLKEIVGPNDFCSKGKPKTEKNGKKMLHDLPDVAKQIHQNAVKHGWWDEPHSFDEIIALIHSEWSEALEEYRAGRRMLWYSTDTANKKKPEGIAVELIDGCIRILDYVGKEGGTIPIEPIEPAEEKNLPKLIAALHRYTTHALESKGEAWRCWLGAAVYACFAYVQANGLLPEKIMLEKHEYNITRPYKHGKVC